MRSGKEINYFVVIRKMVKHRQGKIEENANIK